MSRLEKQPIIAAFVACAMLAALTTTAAAQDLELSVDPYSGLVHIQNQSTTSATSLDGYQITSPSGQLIPTPGVGWTSFTNAGVPGWTEYTRSATSLSELNFSSSTAIPAGGSVNLGYAFTGYGTQDVTWGYSEQTAGTDVGNLPGALQYFGGVILEVITLYGAGSTVESTPMILYNMEPSLSFQFDAYTIQSASGSLNPAGFDGFAGHGATGWQAAGLTTNALSELNLSTSPTMAPLQVQPLGSAFTAGGMNDLVFQLHFVGTATTVTPGNVVYENQLAGDTNNDGVVNGLDIALIASNWLHKDQLPGDANYDGVVNGLDIALVASNWLLHSSGGSGSGSAVVPEPGSLILFSLGLLAVCRIAQRRQRQNKFDV